MVVVVCVVLVGDAAVGQVADAPSVDSVAAGDAALVVVWSAPEGVTGITSYDMRFVRSDAADKSDGNWSVVVEVWTSGLLEYELGGLVNGTGYDVQVRAVTTSGGAWSGTATGTPVASAPVVVGGDRALTVVWATPADVDPADVTAYDVRYIRSDRSDKSDTRWSVVEGVWTSGPLQFVVAGLSNDTGYDMQVRAVTIGPRSWSATGSGTPTDPGGTRSDASAVPLDTPIGGVIGTGTDIDYFEFVLNADTTVVVFTGGGLDTVGVLEDSGGNELQSSDSSYASVGWRSFLMWGSYGAGTYYVAVTGAGGLWVPIR